MQEKFQQHVKEAEQLINETGYHRRDEELAELKSKTPMESGIINNYQNSNNQNKLFEDCFVGLSASAQ
jgi:hypothetical protein